MDRKRKVAQVLTTWLLAVGFALACSLAGCRTNDGNPGDSPSKGFDKCLNHGDC